MADDRPLSTPRRALIAILALAAVLALFRIGHQSYWDDEISTIAVCNASLLKRLIAIVLLDVSPPLYYALLGFWLHVSSAECWTRALSAACWLGGIAFVYSAGLRIVGRRAAAVGGVLLATLPLGVYVAQETRPYALFFLAVSALTWSLARADEPDARAPGAAIVLSSIVVLYSHYYGLLVFASLATWAFLRALWIWRTASVARDRRLRSMALAALCWLPWVPALLIQLRGGQGWRPKLGVASIVSESLTYLTTGHTPRVLPFAHWPGPWPPVLRIVPEVVLVGLLVLAALGALRDRTTRAKMPTDLLWFVLLGPPALLLIASRFVPIFNPRALIGLAGASSLLAGYGLVRLWDRRRAAAVAATAALVGCALLSLWLYYFNPAYEKQNWRVAAERIAAESEPGDCVLFHSQSRALALLYYSRDRFPIRWALDWPQREELSAGAKRARLVGAADDAARECGRVRLVDYHGVGFDRDGVMERRLAERMTPYRTRSYYEDEYAFRVTLYGPNPVDEGQRSR